MAVDFGGYSFLPPSFFDLALTHGNFAHRMIFTLKYSPSPATNISALTSASYALVPFNTNAVGEQSSLVSFLSFPSRPLTRTHRTHCTLY